MELHDQASEDSKIVAVIVRCVLSSSVLFQMVANSGVALPPEDPFVKTLGQGDLPEMLDVMQRTNPGRFGPRTPLLGTYLGLHDDGRLVAMAGERIRVPGYVELSAISTLPEYRRRGFAKRLTLALLRRARSHEEIPFLHVKGTNSAGIALYRELGFECRRELVSISCRPLHDD